MIRVLEVYSESMPSWIATNLERTGSNKYLSKRYDFHNAEFHEEPVPTSNRDKRLKDPNRVNFFLFDEYSYKNNKLAICINDYWETPLRDWDYRSWRDVVNHTVKYAYCDIKSGEGADELRKIRQQLKDGALALQRYDRWYRTDKSGYITDPYKYKRILSTKKLDKYISDLDKVNSIIDEARVVINDFISTVQDPNKLNKLAKVGFNYDKYSHKTYYDHYVSGAIKSFGELFEITKELNRAIENVKNGEPASTYMHDLDELPKSVAKAEALLSKIKEIEL